eukprot:355277-Chlamydomonas_euryale.AAC.1
MELHMLKACSGGAEAAKMPVPGPGRSCVRCIFVAMRAELPLALSQYRVHMERTLLRDRHKCVCWTCAAGRLSVHLQSERSAGSGCIKGAIAKQALHQKQQVAETRGLRRTGSGYSASAIQNVPAVLISLELSLQPLATLAAANGCKQTHAEIECLERVAAVGCVAPVLRRCCGVAAVRGVAEPCAWDASRQRAACPRRSAADAQWRTPLLPAQAKRMRHEQVSGIPSAAVAAALLAAVVTAAA